LGKHDETKATIRGERLFLTGKSAFDGARRSPGNSETKIKQSKAQSGSD